MASPLNDITRALGSLAILPDIGRQIRRMTRDVRLVREAVQELPVQLEALRESVDSLHTDMNRMVVDVADLKGMQDELAGMREDLRRLPFMGRRRGERGTVA